MSRTPQGQRIPSRAHRSPRPTRRLRTQIRPRGTTSCTESRRTTTKPCSGAEEGRVSDGTRARVAGRYAEAEPLLRAELQSAVSVAERVTTLNELGLLGKETGRLDEAQGCYLQALSMVPPDSAEA